MSIGRGRFAAQLNTIDNILRFMELDMDRVRSPNYDGLTVSAFHGLSYLQTWEKCIREGMYDFHLDDGGLFQFCVEGFSPFEARYSYYECPYRCLSYRDFVRKQLGLDPRLAGDLFMTEYALYVPTCSQKDSVTPIRYDYKPAHYVEGRHPASHVHFGHMNNVRVATRRVLARPLSFFLLIIRQHYPDCWSTLLTHAQANNWCRNVREHLQNVDAQYWRAHDQLEMALE
jgi:hypothetical protein